MGKSNEFKDLYGRNTAGLFLNRKDVTNCNRQIIPYYTLKPLIF